MNRDGLIIAELSINFAVLFNTSVLLLSPA